MFDPHPNKTISDKQTYLRHTLSLKDLTEDEITNLARISSFRTFKAEETITIQGVPSKELLIMIDGKGEIWVDQVKIENLTIDPGSILGEFEYFSKNYAATTKVIRFSTFLAISYLDLDHLVHTNPNLGLKLYRIFIFASIAKVRALTESLIYTLENNPAKQIAHDIKTPLAALRTLKKRSFSNLNEALILGIITDRLEKISNSILSSQNNAKANPLTPELLESLINDLIIEKEYQLSENKKLEVHFSKEFRTLNPGLQFRNSDPIELQRIISNLLDNSIEALCTRDGVIKLRVESNASFLSIQIIDNGMGISQEVLPLLGKQRISTKNTETNHGLGLLYATQKLDEWGGRLTFQSIPNRETIVTILLSTQS